MGWKNVHNWRFKIDGAMYGLVDDAYERGYISAGKSKLSRFIEAGVKRLVYAYDFRDKWIHTIDIEDTV
jgi:hypothetical protein